jgi:BirA family biotin operon repressor/biotin-[acetyl-CoA-carboxylase] ligase
LGPLLHTASTGSTNDDLAASARLGDRAPAVLVADHQTAGRGRLGRRWIDIAGGVSSSEASLLVSFRLPSAVSEALDRAAAVSAAALAAADRALAGSAVEVRAKWPNDLLLEAPGLSGKLAGVLSEIVDGEPPVVVVGLGLNVSAAPPEPGAVSLAQAGAEASRDEVLASLLDALRGYLADPARARAELEAKSATIGRRVRVELADGRAVEGVARAIDAAGRLVVASGDQDLRIDAGDVFHLR